MRIVVLGGTGFVGGACTAELVGAGHSVLVIHRGITEPPDRPGSPPHLHGDRSDLTSLQGELRAFTPDALLDVPPMTRADAEAVLEIVDDDWLLIALSSMDVYRAYGGFRGDRHTDELPIDESAPVRDERYPYRDRGNDSYEKLEVEDRYRPRGGVILRLPMVYGPGDPQKREEFVLRRVRAGRSRIPVGPGTLRWSRGSVGEIARGIRSAIEAARSISGEVLNLCERPEVTKDVRGWMRAILGAAGCSAELVNVPEELLPPDLKLTRSFAQDLLFDPSRARTLLGWEHADPAHTVRRSVRWHLAHPPAGNEDDFGPDDVALAAFHSS